MLRAVLPALRSALPSARPSAFAAAARFLQPIAARTYAAAAGLSRSDIESRVMEVMKTFEKVDGGKVRLGLLFARVGVGREAVLRDESKEWSQADGTGRGTLEPDPAGRPRWDTTITMIIRTSSS
jgi:hypothetical protein